MAFRNPASPKTRDKAIADMQIGIDRVVNKSQRRDDWPSKEKIVVTD